MPAIPETITIRPGQLSNHRVASISQSTMESIPAAREFMRHRSSTTIISSPPSLSLLLYLQNELKYSKTCHRQARVQNVKQYPGLDAEEGPNAVFTSVTFTLLYFTARSVYLGKIAFTNQNRVFEPCPMDPSSSACLLRTRRVQHQRMALRTQRS